jgi:hypothetical protein
LLKPKQRLSQYLAVQIENWLLTNLESLPQIDQPLAMLDADASRETELVKHHPIHVVAAWLGNTPTIATRHYLQVTDADFEQATERGEKSGAKSGAENGPEVVQNPVQTVHAVTRHKAKDSPEPLEEEGVLTSRGKSQVIVAKEINGPYRARTCDLFRVKEVTCLENP